MVHFMQKLIEQSVEEKHHTKIRRNLHGISFEKDIWEKNKVKPIASMRATWELNHDAIQSGVRLVKILQ